MATATMYKMKPVYGNSDAFTEPETCMYKMRNIHTDSAEDVVIEIPELLELKNRQEAVLQELAKLKREVEEIGDAIGANSESTPSEVLSPKQPPPTQVSLPRNIVVKASPAEPPLSAYLLCRLAQQHGLDCSLKSHVHSSWTGKIPSTLHNLFDSSLCKDCCVRFIWKSDTLVPNLMVSVAEQSPVLGETNILRYLARLFVPCLYNECDPLETAKIDEWLDTALNSTSPTDGKNFIQNMNTHLGKHKWLSGNSPSIADIYHSITLQNISPGGQFPESILKWIAECQKEFPGFEQVEKLCN